MNLKLFFRSFFVFFEPLVFCSNFLKRTRGLLARKRVRVMRAAEREVLGIGCENYLHHNIKHHRWINDDECTQTSKRIQMSFLEAEREAESNFVNKRIKNPLRNTKQSTNVIKVASLSEMIEELRSNLFLTDPLMEVGLKTALSELLGGEKSKLKIRQNYSKR